MGFRGLSSDSDGSIVYDGKKFIVTNPKKVEPDFKPGDVPVVGLPDSHPANSSGSHVANETGFSAGNGEEAFVPKKKKKKKDKDRDRKPSVESEPDYEPQPVIPPDISELSALGLVTVADRNLPGYQNSMFGDLPGNILQGARDFMTFINGFDDDDGELNPVVAMQQLFDYVKNNLFDGAGWENVQLGNDPVEPESNIWMTLTNAQNRWIETVTSSDEDSDGIAEEESPELNIRTQRFLNENFDDWDADWTTEADLENYLVDRFEELYPEMNAEAFADAFTPEQMIAIYRELIFENLDNYDTYFDENIEEIADDFRWLPELSMMMDDTPLENEALLIEDLGVETPEEAQIQLVRELEFIYENLGIEPPENLNNMSVVELANELYYQLNEEVIPVLYSDDIQVQQQTGDFYRGYNAISDVTNPEERIDRLQGTYEPPDASLLLFVASIFFEPVDWVVTGAEVVSDLMRGDLASAGINATLALLPLVNGRIDNLTDTFRKQRPTKWLPDDSEFVELSPSMQVAEVRSYIESQLRVNDIDEVVDSIVYSDVNVDGFFLNAEFGTSYGERLWEVSHITLTQDEYMILLTEAHEYIHIDDFDRLLYDYGISREQYLAEVTEIRQLIEDGTITADTALDNPMFERIHNIISYSHDPLTSSTNNNPIVPSFNFDWHSFEEVNTELRGLLLIQQRTGRVTQSQVNETARYITREARNWLDEESAEEWLGAIRLELRDFNIELPYIE